MKEFMKEMEISIFGISKEDAHDKQICISCGGDASEFNDELSRKEYYISGLCQKCQNEVF